MEKGPRVGHPTPLQAGNCIWGGGSSQQGPEMERKEEQPPPLQVRSWGHKRQKHTLRSHLLNQGQGVRTPCPPQKPLKRNRREKKDVDTNFLPRIDPVTKRSHLSFFPFR